jgi:nucleotide-binding universal stress UspA family protein
MRTLTSPQADTRTPPFIRKIVVAVDLTARSLETAEYAVNIAKSLGASVVFVYVHPDEMTLSFTAAGRYDVIDFEQRNPRRALVSLAETASKKYPFCTQTFLVGDTARTVVEYARDIAADLIIAGSHQPSFVATLLQLDHAPKIMRLAPCPVLVYRGECEPSKLISDG